MLLSRDNLLAEALRSLIEAPGGVRMIDWHADELDVAIRHADVVIVDMPPNLHERTFTVIDGRFLGRTIVLLQEGEHAEALPPGPPRVILYRPLQIGELWAAITGSTPSPAHPPPAPSAAPDPAVEVPGDPAGTARVAEGLPVSESGRLIGLSGRELEPVIGPGQVAPGMDEATLERLRRWGNRSPQPSEKRTSPDRRRASDEARRARSARAEARKAARAEARQARSARAKARNAARAEAGRARAVRAEARSEDSRQARLARVEARKAARGEAGRARAVRAEAWRATLRGEVLPAGVAAARRGLAGMARPAVVVVAMAVVGLAAAGWRGDGGPDTLAGEVAAVRAAGSAGGGLAVQDPRIGQIEPLHALAVGAWLRATGAEDSLEAAVQAARVPSRFLLALTVALSVQLCLLLMRVGPGTGAAAGPGPAPPHGRPGRAWRLGVAGLAGALVALDPMLVRGGRVATGTVLALALALGTLALAWALPARPALRWLAPVAAGSGLALLVSPLALPVLAVPTVAALLAGRHREAWRTLAALGLGAALWLALPIWVSGQKLGAGQAGWLLGRPPGRGPVAASLAAFPLSWLLVVAGLAAAILAWRHRSGARPDARGHTATTRLLAWAGTTAAGALLAMRLGYPVEQALPFALPAAAVALAFASGWAVTAVGGKASPKGRRVALAGTAVALVGLVAAQGVDWGQRYGQRSDDGLGSLVATVGDQVPDCSAINAGGPDDRARLLDAGARVTDFSSGPAAQAAGVRYFVLTPDAARYGGPTTPALGAWVRQHGRRLAAHASPSYSRVELWLVDAGPLDPVADSLPVPGGIFSNVAGSACGGYRVVDGQPGRFHTAYAALGGKAVLGRPLGSVWTSDGPALQAFDTMVLGAVPTPTGQPTVRPIELPPLLAKLDARAVADAGIPLPPARAPASDAKARTLLDDRVIARAYLGTDPAAASADDWRRARDRFGRPLGTPQVMPDGAVRQPFERVVFELPADGGPPRLAALGRLAVRLGLVPRQARQLEPVPGLPSRRADTRIEPGPLLRLVAVGLGLLALGTGVGALAAWRGRQTRTGEVAPGR
ncbi:MAG TPA: hypothetical protein VGS14_10670 [Actinomycetes bacterium]|nr:hypothetical protein [Actinomycetes bacterium]